MLFPNPGLVSNRTLSLQAQALSILRTFGTDAHVYLPGATQTSYGPELVVNGNFSAGTSGWAISGGAAPFGVTASDALLQFAGSASYVNVGTGTVEIGKSYAVTYTVASRSAGSVRVSLRSSPGTLRSTSGTFTETIVAGSSGNASILIQDTAGTFVGSIDNISVREVITSAASISGLTAGNYLDSNGSTGFAAVDGLDGLVLDAAGSVGSELVANGDFSAGATGWSAKYSAIISAVSDGLKVEIAPAQTTGRVSSVGFATVVGATYLLQASVQNVNASTAYIKVSIFATLDSASVNTTNILSGASGVVNQYFVATATTTYVGGTADGVAGGYALFDNISVKEVTGIHATASGAARPTLRRGAYNLLTYSQNVNQWSALTRSTCSGAAINAATAPDGTLTGDMLVEDATASSTHYARNSIVKTAVVTTYTYSVYLKAAERTWAQISIGHDASPLLANVYIDLSTGALGASAISVFTGLSVATPTDAGNGWWRCAITATTGTELSVNGNVLLATGNNVNIFSGGGTSGIYVWGAQLETGSTVSAYSPTTTAAASNATAGRYSSQYSGAQSLALGSVPFQMVDDHCVIAGASPAGAATDCDVFGQRSTAATNPLCPLLRFGADGKVKGLWRDDAGVIDGSAMVASYVASGVYVVSARKVGNAKKVRMNGVDGPTVSTVIGTTTINTSTIGAGVTFGVLGNFFGTIGPVIAIKGTVSDADLLTLERFVASLTPNGPSF